MSTITIEQFSGQRPRIDQKLISLENSQKAINVDVLSGKLRPLKEPKDIFTLPDTSRQSIFPYNNSYLSFTTDVDFVRTPINNDQFQRIYYTGNGTPKVRGIINNVEQEYDLGVPAPSTAPSVALISKSTTDYTRNWGYFYEETNGSQVDIGTLSENSIEVTEDTVGLNYSVKDRGRFSITGITQANPAVVTTGAAHGMATGERAAIKSVVGMTEVNDKIYTVTVLSTTTLQLDGIDSTAFTAYSSGGTLFPLGVPPRLTATASAKLILFFDAVDSFGNNLGRLYPDISSFVNSSDFTISNTTGVGKQINVSDDGIAPNNVTFDVSYSPNGNITDLDRSYVYTFVSVFGEEGAPSSPSAVVPVTPAQDVDLTNMDTTFTGNYNIVKKRIYRTVVGTSSTNFQFVAEINLSVSSFTDGIADENTGEVLPSQNWDIPPADLKGLVAMPGGFLAGFTGKSVRFSVPFQPHAFPIEFETSVFYDIVAIGATGNSLVVATTEFPSILTTIDPSSVTETRLELNQACVSKRGLTDVGNAIVYPSPDGLVMIRGAVARIITDNLYQRIDWQKINPSTMIAGMQDRNLYMFTSTNTIILDLDERGGYITESDQKILGLYVDTFNDVLAIIQGDRIKQWDNGVNNLSFEWKSKKFRLDKPTAWSAARIIADSYPITLEFYANDALVLTYTVNNDRAFRVPSLRPERYWEFNLKGSVGNIDSLIVSTSMGGI